MFWALILEPFKRYSQHVMSSFHVSMASLDLSTTTTDAPVQVVANYNNKNYLLCTLDKKTTWQVPLDLNFEKQTSITFLCNGKGHVHLTGYMLVNESWSDSESSDDEVEEQKVMKERLAAAAGKSSKRKATEFKESTNMKKAKHINKESAGNKSNGQDVDESMDEDTSDDSKDEDLYRGLNEGVVSDEEDDDNESDEDDEDEDEDDEDEDEEEDEDEAEDEKAQQKQKQQQKNLAKLQQQPAKSHKQNQQQQQDQQRKHDKQKLLNGKEAVKQQEQSQSKRQKKDKTEQQQQQQKKPQTESKKRIVEGGVQIEEIKFGNGAPAKHGKLISVYYVGRCKIGKEEKKIDSCLQGNGFKFRLGKGDVIKGWDVGLVGMKVGGKRRITIPASMGYGAKGSPPTIPGNSTLVFDIELKSLD